MMMKVGDRAKARLASAETTSRTPLFGLLQIEEVAKERNLLRAHYLRGDQIDDFLFPRIGGRAWSKFNQTK